MDYETLKLEKTDAVAIITLDRPPLNAVNETLLNELAAVCDALEADDAIHVVILTGAGKAFSAGRELPGILDGTEYPGGPRYQALERLGKPVIAAVNGYCLTGSFELAMCADIIIASEKALFGDTHARFGVTPGGGQTQRLPRLIGSRRAKELLFTCDTIPAAEAERLGIVNKVVPAHDLMPQAMAMAQRISKNVPETIRTIKSLINKGQSMDLASGLKMEADQHGGRPISPTPEGRRRIQAFLDRNRSGE
jgi:enoyl-CoA hydratase